MSPDPTCSGSVRSAAQLNEDIRNLWLRARGGLTAEERAEYERLLTRWAAALKAEIITAA
jgi:hypothetical protein